MRRCVATLALIATLATAPQAEAAVAPSPTDGELALLLLDLMPGWGEDFATDLAPAVFMKSAFVLADGDAAISDLVDLPASADQLPIYMLYQTIVGSAVASAAAMGYAYYVATWDHMMDARREDSPQPGVYVDSGVRSYYTAVSGSTASLPAEVQAGGTDGDPETTPTAMMRHSRESYLHDLEGAILGAGEETHAVNIAMASGQIFADAQRMVELVGYDYHPQHVSNDLLNGVIGGRNDSILSTDNVEPLTDLTISWVSTGRHGNVYRNDQAAITIVLADAAERLALLRAAAARLDAAATARGDALVYLRRLEQPVGSTSWPTMDIYAGVLLPRLLPLIAGQSYDQGDPISSTIIAMATSMYGSAIGKLAETGVTTITDIVVNAGVYAGGPDQERIRTGLATGTVGDSNMPWAVDELISSDWKTTGAAIEVANTLIRLVDLTEVPEPPAWEELAKSLDAMDHDALGEYLRRRGDLSELYLEWVRGTPDATLRAQVIAATYPNQTPGARVDHYGWRTVQALVRDPRLRTALAEATTAWHESKSLPDLTAFAQPIADATASVLDRIDAEAYRRREASTSGSFNQTVAATGAYVHASVQHLGGVAELLVLSHHERLTYLRGLACMTIMADDQSTHEAPYLMAHRTWRPLRFGLFDLISDHLSRSRTRTPFVPGRQSDKATDLDFPPQMIEDFGGFWKCAWLFALRPKLEQQRYGTAIREEAIAVGQAIANDLIQAYAWTDIDILSVDAVRRTYDRTTRRSTR